VSLKVRLYSHEDGSNGHLSRDQSVEQVYGFLAPTNDLRGGLQIVGTAFANADSITIPPHLAGDVIIIFAWRDGNVTPPSVGAGYFTLVSGGSSLNSNRIGWTTAASSATTSGTWANATRLSCIVVRNATIDESSADLGGGSTDDFFWGSVAFASSRQVILFGENNATYVGGAAAVVPSTQFRNVAFVPNQGSVIHISTGPVLGPVDQFASLTSSGGTPRYRTGLVPLVVTNEKANLQGYLARDKLFQPTEAIPPPAEPTGTLAATEIGDDVFAGTGDVAGGAVTGDLAATEAGVDTFAGTGAVLVSGTLAVTEVGNDTFAGTGSVLVSGTLAATETGADTFAGTGAVLVSGSLAVTEAGNDTFAGTGAVLVSGTLAATETGADTFAASGTVGAAPVTGTLAATEAGADTFAGTGAVLVSGALAVTEAGNDVFAGAGFANASGTLAATETGADIFAGAGFANASGTLAATETGADIFAGTGTVAIFPATGTLAATEAGADDFTATGSVLVSGTLAATEVGLDAFVGVMPGPITGVMIASEQGGGLLFGAKQIRRIYYGAIPVV
jgi:hypothetical protein